VNAHRQYVSPSEAAKRLGVSAKALRIYEQCGLLTPVRTAAGWRTYGPDEMDRATEIVALRALGFSLAQIGRVLKGDAQELEPALASHQAVIESEIRRLTEIAGKVHGLRSDLAGGGRPPARDLVRLLMPAVEFSVALDLPWPWGGERFELRGGRRLTYIVGPLGSGKTRLAQCLAAALPNSSFLGLERLGAGAQIQAGLDADSSLKARVDTALAWIVGDGGHMSDALVALIAGLESEGPDSLIIDMIEQGLDQDTQEALIAYLRHGRRDTRPLYFLTRSCAILDLASVGADEAIILCPANHSPPTYVAPYPGSPGYEAVATCLAAPHVRARTEGVIAWRPARAEPS
jgi:DNA-binding transcriptional MerR regulator